MIRLVKVGILCTFLQKKIDLRLYVLYDLAKIETWSVQWLMKPNVEKCSVCIGYNNPILHHR